MVNPSAGDIYTSSVAATGAHGFDAGSS